MTVGKQPTPEDITRAVEGRAAVSPSSLWHQLGGEGAFAPAWVFDHLRRLGYGSHPAGFFWRSDIPMARAERLVWFMDELDRVYPGD